MGQHTTMNTLIKSSLTQFAGWLAESDWIGKEHDCVNLFVMKFLMPLVGPDAPIKQFSQIRIEGGVAQPSGYNRPSARKDIVIWPGPLDVTWDSEFNAIHAPSVILEWKVKRIGSGKKPLPFDDHDRQWLVGYTKEYPETTGYLVSVDFRGSNRQVRFAKVVQGQLADL